MKSIKNIGVCLSIDLILIIIVTIVINIMFTQSSKELAEIEKINIELSRAIEEIEDPIRVFDNISSVSNYSKENEIRLLEAQGENVRIQKTAIIEAKRYLNKISKIILENSNFCFDKDCIMELQLGMDQIQLFADNIYEEASLLKYRSIIMNKDITEQMELNYESMKEELVRYQNVFFDLKLRTKNVYMRGINISIIIIVIISGLLLLLNYRLIHTDLTLINHTYKQVSNHEFNIEKVLTKKPIFDEEVEIYSIIERFFSTQNIVKDFKELVSKNYVIDEIIDHLLIITHHSMGVNRVGIAFYDETNNMVITEYSVATYDKLFLKVGYKTDLESSELNAIRKSKMGVINNDISNSLNSHTLNPSLKLLNQEGIHSNLAIPLIMNDEVFGVVFFGSLKKNNYSQEDYDIANGIIYEVTGALNRAYFMKVFINRITNTFARLVDKKDIETGDHLSRMTQYSVVIARGLKDLKRSGYEINNKMILDIERNATIHDIGKIGTPDNILKKPGKLTDDEFEIMKEHSIVGGDIFKELNDELSSFSDKIYNVAEIIARYHHEKWDGSGYPEGLTGFDIPLEARIVALADVFDALTSKRVYKDAFSFEKSVDIIRNSSGSHFDPVVVEAFEYNLANIKNIHDTK